METTLPEWSVRRPRALDQLDQLPYEEAILDVVGWNAVHSERVIIDVTIRHPLAKKYMPMASVTDGFANVQASEDKKRRYPDRAGLRVTVASVESFGRLGDSFNALLNELSWSAKQCQWARGIPATEWSKKWRASISTILARGTAKAVRESLQGNGTVSSN